jgi:predicted AAA+ superfamily ATPase
LSDAFTKSRELSALVEAAKGLELHEAKIITYNFEGEEVFDEVSIKYIPFWIWALRNMQ